MDYKVGQPAIAFPSNGNGIVSVVGSQFCVPNPEHLVITQSSRSQDGFRGFIVSNSVGAVLLRVKLKSGGFFSRPKQLVEDISGNTLLTLKPKASSSHYGQRAFKGSSTDLNDILFTTKVSRFRWKTMELNVFLKANTDEKVPDFKMKSRYGLKECTFFCADSGSGVPPFAKITKDKKPFHLCGSVKDSWQVDLAQHIDYAFIVTLFIMVLTIEASRRSSSSSSAAGASSMGMSGVGGGGDGGGGGGC